MKIRIRTCLAFLVSALALWIAGGLLALGPAPAAMAVPGSWPGQWIFLNLAYNPLLPAN